MSAIVYLSHVLGDRKHCRPLETHLASCKRGTDFELWHRGLVRAGDDEESVALFKLRAAALILLLVSADYLASDVGQLEMKAAFERLERQGIKVIPVHLGNCTPPERVATRVALPAWKEKPILSRSGRDAQDKAWKQVAEQIAEALQQALQQPIHPASPPSPGPDWASSPPPGPSATGTPPNKELRRRLRELLSESLVLQELLARAFDLDLNDKASGEPMIAGEDRFVDAVLCSLLDQSRTAHDLSRRCRRVVEAPECSEGVRTLLVEVAARVLPLATDFQSRLDEWKRQLANKLLVLPFASRLMAELALSSTAGRRMAPEVRPVSLASADKELVSPALFPSSDIRSASSVAMTGTSRHLIEEIAYYFSTRVRFGPRRSEYGKFLYPDPKHVDLTFKETGALQRVLQKIHGALLYHSDAADDDLLPMHVEIDDAKLFDRLRDADDRLLRDLGEAFPLLSFVRLTDDAPDETYIAMCLTKIFLPKPKVSV